MVIKKGLLLTKSTSVLKGRRLKTLQGYPRNCYTWGQLVPGWCQTWWYVLSIMLVGSAAANKNRMANAQPYTNLCKYWSANGGDWEIKRTTKQHCAVKICTLKCYVELLLSDSCLWCASVHVWIISTHPLVLVKGKLGTNSKQELVCPDFKPNCDCLITNLAKCAHFFSSD